MARVQVGNVIMTVDEVIYESDNYNIAVYICDGELVIDDGSDEERTEDTPENRTAYIAQAVEYDA